jgi:hypothetical protein
MVQSQAAIDTGQGPAVDGYGISTTAEDGRHVGRRGAAFGLATVPGLPPADPRVRELTEKYNQLEQEVLQLASEFRRLAADSPEREAAIKKITEITQQQFQLRHDARQREIEKLQKQLQDLQGKLQRREEKRDQIVQQRVEQLTDQKDDLRWEPLDPAGADYFNPYGAGARYVPYGDVYRRGVALPPAAVYGGQLIPPQADQPEFPHSARDDQQPSTSVDIPGMPVNPDVLTAQPPLPSPIQVPPHAEGMLPPPDMDLSQNRTAQSILEAKVRLESAAQELKTLKAQFEAGQIPSRELQRAEADRKLAEAAFKMAQQQHDLQLKMLGLDLRRAQATLEAAKADLDAKVEEAGDRHNPAIDASIRKAKANLAQMELDVARAEAWLQAIQQQGDGSAPEPTPGQHSPQSPRDEQPTTGGLRVPDGQLRLRIVELGGPIRVGEATNYELLITNDRSVSDYNVVLRVELPDGLKFVGLAGIVAGRKVSPDGRTIEVSPIKEIRAGETHPPFQLSTTGVQIGEHKISISVTSQLSPQGVTAENTTSVTAQ